MDVAPRQPGLELILNTTPIQMLVLENAKDHWTNSVCAAKPGRGNSYLTARLCFLDENSLLPFPTSVHL
jgi:hypothetical protein